MTGWRQLAERRDPRSGRSSRPRPRRTAPARREAAAVRPDPSPPAPGAAAWPRRAGAGDPAHPAPARSFVSPRGFVANFVGQLGKRRSPGRAGGLGLGPGAAVGGWERGGGAGHPRGGPASPRPSSCPGASSISRVVGRVPRQGLAGATEDWEGEGPVGVPRSKSWCRI